MNKIVSKLREIKILLNEDKLAAEGARYMKSITPIRSGNAKRKTTSNKNVIEANYPYAKRLDEGWSQQNQIGLIQPTIDHLEELIKKGAI
jgi:hypothetical protein